MFGQGVIRLLLAALFAIAMPAAALSHAVFLGSEPPGGATVEEPPSEIVLQFNEPVSPIRVQVLGPGGDAVADTGAARSDNQHLRIELPGQLEQGTHLVSYRVRSLDGHPVGGSVSFSVGAATGEPEAAHTAPPETIWRIAEGAARFLQILSLFLVAGGALFVLAVAKAMPPSGLLRRILLWGAAIGIVATILRTGFYGALLHGAAPLQILTVEVWQAGLTGVRGLSALLAVTGLAALAAGFSLSRLGPRIILLALGVLAAVVSFPVTGHAAATEPRWLAMALLGLHVAAAAFWAGSLMPLWLHAQHGENGLATVVGRFSRIAIGVVAALIAAGLILAWLIIGELSALWASTYGTVLLGKVGLVALLVAIAALNKLALLPRLRMGDYFARRRLSRNIVYEMVLVVLVIGVTVVLAQSMPPHHHHHPEAELPEPAQRFVTAFESGERQLVLSIQPAQPGRNELLVQVMEEGGGAVEPLEVTIDIANEERGIEPFRREMTAAGGGRFMLAGDEFSFPGEWQLRIDVLITDFEKDIFRGDIEIE